MKVIIGSKNKIKVEAVKEVAKGYDLFKEAVFDNLEVSSGVADQPKSLKEVVCGAQNRAKNAFDDCKLSFGLESGLMEVPGSKSGVMDLCVCAIFDGEAFHLGLSSCFECPTEMNRLMLEEGLDMSQACNRIGLTDNPRIGSEEGAIGILTRGRMTRKDYTKQSIITALIHLENAELY
ncbi:DUF84 family protein [bacterium]|jgi:inosine/xanthosine triphosphatase|nr:DUF84 family protein [bacterium]MBT4251222.1 DUF84 family protein [bacterium]MBT4597986.1 DUF84 family protein [bacterium]MBT6753601.1 DUF84 family protein [bacterium]MBT7037716.1 DUF84 family protein [bacterium]